MFIDCPLQGIDYSRLSGIDAGRIQQSVSEIVLVIYPPPSSCQHKDCRGVLQVGFQVFILVDLGLPGERKEEQKEGKVIGLQ